MCTDNATAFALMVEYGINVEFNFQDCVGKVYAAQTLGTICEESFEDNAPEVATRLAIINAVKAAKENKWN